MRRALSLALMLVLMLGAASAAVNPAATATSVSISEAHGLLAAGRVDEALKALTLQLKSAPGDAAAYNLLCRSYFAVQNWSRAVATCERAVSLAPDNSEYHMWLGRAYGEKANHSIFIIAAQLARKVRREFERAVELDANNVHARTDLAEFYVEAPAFMGGGKTKAEREAEAIAKQDAGTAHWVQARIAEKEERFEAAEQEYKKAIEASGNRGSFWLNLASFYRRQSRLSDMEAAINSAMASEKKRPIVFFDAAQILLGAGRNFAGAAGFIRHYLKTGPIEEGPAFQAHYLLGEILEKQGDKPGAMAEYRAALALARDYERARTALEKLSEEK